jgi:hypothetical protein
MLFTRDGDLYYQIEKWTTYQGFAVCLFSPTMDATLAYFKNSHPLKRGQV